MMIVKKYSNRRLYDTEQSKYITLEELAQRIRDGADVRVLDAKTNADLTQTTLVQIILEGEASQLLPVPLLMQLIRMGDDAAAEFFGKYMGMAMEWYLSAKYGLQQAAPMFPFAQLPMQATNAILRMFSGGGFGAPTAAPGPMPSAPPPSPPTPAPSNDDDVAELRRELEALKREMKSRRRA